MKYIWHTYVRISLDIYVYVHICCLDCSGSIVYCGIVLGNCTLFRFSDFLLILSFPSDSSLLPLYVHEKMKENVYATYVRMSWTCIYIYRLYGCLVFLFQSFKFLFCP